MKAVVDTNVVAYLLLGTTAFVELAARSSCPMVTFDRAVLKAFPDIAFRPRDLVGR